MDWCCLTGDHLNHLVSLGGDEQYETPREGGRQTESEGKRRDLRWRVTFPRSPPRGRLPFMCEDVTPREWRVPAPPAAGHPNGAKGVRAITLLAEPTRLAGSLYNPLVVVLGRAAEMPMDMSASSTKRPSACGPQHRTSTGTQ